MTPCYPAPRRRSCRQAIAAAPFATSSPAWAGQGGGLVRVSVGNVNTIANVTAAPQICVGNAAVLVGAFQTVDQHQLG